MLQSRVKFKFKDSNRWTNEERPSVEELISIKNHESLTKGDQGFMYNLLCSFRIYNFHNNLITFRNEVFSLLLAWEIAWAVRYMIKCSAFLNFTFNGGKIHFVGQKLSLFVLRWPIYWNFLALEKPEFFLDPSNLAVICG